MTSGWVVVVGQDWVTRAGFNLTLETIKDSTKYIYVKTALNTKDISNKRQRLLGDGLQMR